MIISQPFHPKETSGSGLDKNIKLSTKKGQKTT